MSLKSRDELLVELAELEAANEAATSWGAAVGARHERIKQIQSTLRHPPYEAPPSEVQSGDAPNPDIFAIHQALKVANIEYAAFSCNGFNLIGDAKSIKEAAAAFHHHAQVDQFRTHIRHWREECGKLDAKLRSLSAAQAASKQLSDFAELKLLIDEYDPTNSDWNFRRGVLLDILVRLWPQASPVPSAPRGGEA